jgi:hypothetical protein
MDARYDTYGFVAATLEETAPRVQQLLGLPLQERDSSYYAGTYYLYSHSDGKLRLFQNFDPIQGAWVRERYCDYAVILEVSNLDDMDTIQQKLMTGLESIALLESETINLPAEPDDEPDDED